ncbi:MAG: hypothetical protein ACR2MN_01325 [Acidimicrobiales bacterium]
MSKRLTAAETDALAKTLAGALALIRADELTASTATVYRIEGAIAALEAVAGKGGDDLLGVFLDHS